MRVLVAPQEFKGSLTAAEAAEAIGAGVRLALPGVEVDLLPLSDGGPGFVDAMEAALGGTLQTSPVGDPLGRQVAARWLLAPDATAYVEAAQAFGAEIHGREQVLEWQTFGDGVRVITDRDRYEADRLVVTAGAWNSTMIDVLSGLAVPERQVLAWLQPRRPELFRPDNFPVFNLLVE